MRIYFPNSNSGEPIFTKTKIIIIIIIIIIID